MYRRNISHVLYIVAGIVGLLVAYGAWVKPVNQSPPLPLPHELLQPQDTSIASETPPDKPIEPPQQSRLIQPVALPNSPYRETLVAIHDEIEQGNLKEALARLTSASGSFSSDAAIRPHLAILWNNLGIEQEKQGGTKASIHAFKQAASLDSENPVVLMNLAHASWEQRDPLMTTGFLERLIALAPEEPFPHIALADLLQERDRLHEAAEHLDHAHKRSSRDPGTQAYLRTVAAKVRGTARTEARLNRRDSAHFTVKYDGTSDPDTWTIVLDILEEAYREIGQQFGHFPATPIVVVLHDKGAFQGMTGNPAWADGLFDPVLGRIQIPVQGALTDLDWLKRVLRHEYVHALLQDLQGPNSAPLPTWLNEGLAMQLSRDRWTDFEQLYPNDIPFIPLTALEGGWGGLSHAAATVAYMEANAAVGYLIDRYGMHEVRQLLARLKQRQAIAAAMLSQLSLSYEQLDSRWVERIQGKQTSG